MKPAELAEAIKTQLEAATFSIAPASVLRGYNPETELDRDNQLHLIVVPKSKEITLNDETAWDREQQIDVGVLYKFKHPNNAQIPNATIDPVAAVADEISEYFLSDEYEPPGDLTVIDAGHDPLFVPEHLRRLRQFTSVITVTFQEVI